MRILLAAFLVILLYAVFEHVAEGSARFIIILVALHGVLVGWSCSSPREVKYVHLKPKPRPASLEEQLTLGGADFDAETFLKAVRNVPRGSGLAGVQTKVKSNGSL